MKPKPYVLFRLEGSAETPVEMSTHTSLGAAEKAAGAWHYYDRFRIMLRKPGTVRDTLQSTGIRRARMEWTDA